MAKLEMAEQQRLPRINVDGALRYATGGGKVVPVGANKASWVKKWQEKATSDPEQIEAWHDQRPDTLFAATLAGLFVFDCDTAKKDGERDGAEWPRGTSAPRTSPG